MNSGKKDNSIRLNLIFNSIYQITNFLVPLVTLPYLSRILKADGLGEYSYAHTVAYYFYLFIRLGLYSYGNRTIAYVKDDSELLSKTFCEIYAFQFFMGIFGSIIYFMYCFLAAPKEGLALVFSLIVVAGGIDFTWVLNGLEEFKVTSTKDVLTKIITAICIFIFVKSKNDVWKYALIFSLGFIMNQLIALSVVVRKIRFVMPQFKNILKHIKPNMILFLPTVAASIYKAMDKIMLGSMTNEIELGYYHSCENIIRVPMALIDALGTVMLPRVSNMISKRADKDSVNRLFNKSILFAMFISTSTCMGIMAVAKEFVPIYYGSGFDKCVYLFYVILPSCIFLAFANVIRTQYLLPRKKDRLFVISLFAGAFANVCLNIILIPRYESIGAAIGTLVAEIVVCVFQAICVYKEANIARSVLDSIPFLLSGLVMVIVLWNYTPRITNSILVLIVKIMIGCVCYFGCLVIFTGVQKFINANLYKIED